MPEPRNDASNYGGHKAFADPSEMRDLAKDMPHLQHPKITITHETSAEVRSATHIRDIIAIVHPKLGEIGGVQMDLRRELINHAERLAPGCRLYILQGRIEQGDCLANIEFIYAMGSEETFEQARDWLVKAWGFEAQA